MRGLFFFLIAFGFSVVQADEISVAAAASLNEAFKSVIQGFELAYPEHSVQLTLASSGALLQQMRHGAPIDVFASADLFTMDKAEEYQLIAAQTRHNFAQNTLVVITPVASNLLLSKLNELTQAKLQKIALGNPDSVPAGRYSQAVLTEAKLWPALQEKFIYTQNVRQALDYVARGEVDAGFVYRTDAALLSDKVQIAFKPSEASAIVYPIAALQNRPHLSVAQLFIDYVLSPKGQAALADYGFLAP